MNLRKQKRQRGIILTSEGIQKLQQARLELELKENFGVRFTFEQLSERTGLDLNTIKKVLDCQQGVDKRTLERMFIAFGLELGSSCYSNSNPVRHQDWGEAVCTSTFYGRAEDLVLLEQWIFEERCRLVAVLGMGGIGKTTLSIKLAEQIQDKFEYVVWRSLRDAPSVEAIVGDLIHTLSNQQETLTNLSDSLSKRLSLLIDYLRQYRCLLVMDNTESILRSGSRAGQYRAGYEGYGELLRRIGEATHQSCLMLTSREKPKEVASLEGEALPVRSRQLYGLKEKEGKEILKLKGLSGSEDEFKALIERYAGNALALKVVATSIQDLFEGKISAFLQQDTAIFGDIRDLLDQQFERLSDLEQEIMYWLAINREPVQLSELREDIVSPVSTAKLLEALESLERRSLVETTASLFTLQPVIMEYVTNCLIERVCEEIVTQNIVLFRCHALMKAQAKDYIREAQIQFIVKPLIDDLLTLLKSEKNIESQLNKILVRLRETSPLELGYTSGNILNLFCHLKTDLSGYDFSQMTVWQADLRNVNLHNVNFARANLSKSVFAETFGGILSIAFSPDGKILATGDTNGEILLRQVADGKHLLTCKGHTNWVTSLAFSPKCKVFASSSSDHTVKLWDICTGQCLHILREHDNEVWSVAFSHDGYTLVSGSDDLAIRIWCVDTGECLRVFQGHTSWVLSVAVSRDGQTIVSGGNDNTVRLWDINTGKCLKIFPGHCDGIRSISLNSQGTMLASGSNDNTVRLWDINTGECLRVFQEHSNGVWSVAFSPQDDLLASGSNDNTVRLWDINTGECLRVFQEHSNGVWSVAFSPQDDLLASGSRDQTVRLWSLSTGKCLKTFQGYTNQILSVNFSPDGRMLASGSHDRTVKLWDVITGETQKTLHGHSNWVYSVAFSLQGNTLVSCSGDKTIKLWNASTGQTLRTFQGHSAAIWSVAFNPQGTMLVSGSEDQTVKLWEIDTSQALRTLHGHQSAVRSVAFSPQGTIIASGAWDQTIKLWDTSTGECLRTLEGHETWVWAVAFSPDGNTIASTSLDRTLRLWSVHTGECLRLIQVSTSWLQSVAFSPDSQTIAGGSLDHTIKLWDVSSHQLLKNLPGHAAWIWSVAFSPDNRTLASSSEDETIKLWDTITGECLKVLRAERPYARMNILDVSGLTEATIAMLKVLGAVD